MSEKSSTPQTFDFETVAVILCCMLESGITLGGKHYKLMSAIDGTRTEVAFQHKFRKVKARAKELHEQALKNGNSNNSNDSGGEATEAMPAGGKKKRSTPGKGRAKAGSGSSAGKKRGQQAAAEMEFGAEEKEGGDEADVEESPSKKIKREVVDEEEYEFV